MATNYKIRLRRFNGLDYDTLNLSSENIIRNNGNTVEQEFNNIIPSSNGILKNNNGIFNVATLGTDYTAVDDSLVSSATKTYSITKQRNTFSTFDMLGIVIDGNSTPVGASVGQYVIVKNSTISGVTDGLYTAAQAIPANTAIDSTYLTAVSDGGLNAAKRDAQWKLVWTNPNPTSAFASQTLSLNLTGYSEVMVRYTSVDPNSSDNSLNCDIGFIPGVKSCGLWLNMSTTSNPLVYYRRNLNVSTSGIVIADCVGKEIGGTGTILNSSLVPRYIYAR